MLCILMFLAFINVYAVFFFLDERRSKSNKVKEKEYQLQEKEFLSRRKRIQKFLLQKNTNVKR